MFLTEAGALKGPYERERWERVFERSQFFRAWGVEHVVHPVGSWLSKEDQLYILYPNLMAGYSCIWEEHAESFTSYRYRVLVRQEVRKFHEVAKEGREHWIYSSSLLVALVSAWILQVGDMNGANLLVDTNKKLLYLIDYDENLSTDRTGLYFYFNKDPAKGLRLSEKMAPHIPATLRVLEEWKASLATGRKDFTTAHQERLLRAIDLLRSPLFSSVPSVSSPPTVTLVVTDGTVGKMEWRGPFGGSTTYSGYELDVMKSGLQKYVRRGEVWKALCCGFELWRMEEVGGRAAVSNLYNRVAVISVEDVGPANLPLVIQVVRLVNEENRDPATLAAMIQLLAQSPKTRLMSHISYAYRNPEGQERARKEGIVVVDTSSCHDIESIVTHIDLCLKNRDLNVFTWVQHFSDLITRTKTKGPRTPKTRDPQKGSYGKKPGHTTNPMALIWDLLRPYFQPHVIDVLATAYYKQSEKGPFLSTALTAALYRNDGGRYEDMERSVARDIETWRSHPTLELLIHSRYSPLVIDSYVIDKHTKEGRLKGSTLSNFVTEGAQVHNQDPTYQILHLQRLYETRT